MSELKPCPFCGGDVFGRPDENQKVKYVHCITCGTEGPAAHTMEDAADKWNTRQSPWISVYDYMPAPAEFPVICYTPVESARHRIMKDRQIMDAMSEITHWMPILPTGEVND